MRAALVVVALLLAPAIASGATPHPEATAVDESATNDTPLNRIAHLTLGGGTEALANQSVNATSAVTIGRGDAAARLEDYAAAERLNRTNRTGAVLDRTLDGVEARMNQLETDSRRLGSRYANGSITPRQFVHGVAKIQARTARLEDRLRRLDGQAGQYGNATHRDRIDHLEQRLLGHAGPVRDRVLDAVAGRTGTLHVYAAGSENGVTFAAIDGGEYVRGAYRGDRRGDPPAAISLRRAFERFEDLYPVAFGFSDQLSLQGINDDSEVYRLEKQLPFGTLVSYLDGRTEDVFHEVQRRQLDRIDQPASATATANGTRLIVNRSHVGGPLRIATDENGSAVGRTIQVGERRVDTGGDGVAWTLMPPARRVEVTATGPEGTVTVTVEPIPVTPVNGSTGS